MVILHTRKPMVTLFRATLVATALIVFSTSAKSQNTWDLRRCIEYAVKQNIQVKQSTLQVDMAKTGITQSYATLAPSVNGSANHVYNIGRRIDPFTNQFAESSVRSNNFSVNANLNLFSGLTSINTIKQNQALYLASFYDNAALINDISVNVASAFLQAVFAEDNLKNAKEQLDITTQQVNRNKILFDAGTISQGALLDLQAQQATEELNVVNAQNTYDLALLALVQLLNLPAEDAKGFTLKAPEVDPDIKAIADSSTSKIFSEAVVNRPEMAASTARIKSSGIGLAIARGNYYPQLSAFAAVGTGYSQLQRSVTGTTTEIVPIGATQGGEIVYTQVITPTTVLTPFGDQLNNNFNRAFGFQMNIPIFNGLQVRTNVAKAKINYEISKLNYDQDALNLRKNIEQAFTDAKSAYKRYVASKKSFDASEEAFKYAQARFDAGVINGTDFAVAKNRLTLAQSSLLQAKYDYLFKSKVLNFYKGIPLFEDEK